MDGSREFLRLARMERISMIEVEVTYALAERQVLRRVRLAAGATVADAVRESGLAEDFPETDLTPLEGGIFGRVVPRNRILEAGDRVELYRPLSADPKLERRRRVQRARRGLRN